MSGHESESRSCFAFTGWYAADVQLGRLRSGKEVLPHLSGVMDQAGLFSFLEEYKVYPSYFLSFLLKEA